MTGAQTAQQGYTLVEVLVALALMALLSVISWRALDLVQRSNTRLIENADDTMALVRVLGQIESDIRRHATTDVGLSISPDTVRSTPHPTGAAGLGLPAGLLWNEPGLNIVRSAREGHWQRVIWGQDGDALRRAAGPASQTLPLPAAGTGEVMLDHVQRFRVRGWVSGQGWSALDSTGSQATASGLEIVIERLNNGVTEAYRKVVLLP